MSLKCEQTLDQVTINVPQLGELCVLLLDDNQRDFSIFISYSFLLILFIYPIHPE